MNSIFMVKNDELICLKDSHNEQVKFAIMNDLIPFSEKFYCQKCLEHNQTNVNMIPFNSALALIKDKIVTQNQKQQFKREQSIKNLQNFSLKLKDLQTKVMMLFNEIQQICQQWKSSLQNKFEQDDLLSVMQQFESFKEQDFQQNNQEYFIKMALIYKLLLNFQDYKDCYTILKQIVSKEKSIINLEKSNHETMPSKQGKIILSQIVSSVQQNEWGCALAFNQSGTIMASGCNEMIKIWNFDKGKLTEGQKLSGHTSQVNCIVFSKILNWFASGSNDATIRCWKELSNNEWMSYASKQKHFDIVVCLIINKYENQLISCSLDRKIIVWNVYCLNNELEYHYTLDIPHTGAIYSISMNESETSLVSCSNDKKIILWRKDQKDKWVYQHSIINEDYGMRICFYNNTQFAWLQCHQGILKIFKIENSQIIPEPQFNIELNKENDQNCLFPGVVNKEKQIIILKHNKQVYILQKQENNKFIYESINCNHCGNFGALTNDGEYLVIWDFETKRFKVFHIKLE